MSTRVKNLLTVLFAMAGLILLVGGARDVLGGRYVSAAATVGAIAALGWLASRLLSDSPPMRRPGPPPGDTGGWTPSLGHFTAFAGCAAIGGVTVAVLLGNASAAVDDGREVAAIFFGAGLVLSFAFTLFGLTSVILGLRLSIGGPSRLTRFWFPLTRGDQDSDDAEVKPS